MWDYSRPGRVGWGTIGSMPANFGNMPKVRERQETSSRKASQYWQVARVAGKVPNVEKSWAEASRNSAMRGVHLHIYYIDFGQ